MPRPLATGLLVLTTILWGLGFVAQKTAMDSLGPFGFSAIRYALAALLVLPLAVWEYRRNTIVPSRRDRWAITLIAVSFFLGVYLQQLGLTMTTVTNAGFLTSTYVLFTPLLAAFVLFHRPHPIIWAGIPVALVGVYLLNGGRFDNFNLGDLVVIASAVAWAFQILLIGVISKRTGLPVTISVICFAVTALLSTVGGFAIEAPTWHAFVENWPEIAYSAVVSTAIAFTLQAVAQQHVPPANAAIILSAEGLFAAIGGALLLGERLSLVGYVGAALIFLAILMVELVPALRRPAVAN